MYEFKLPDVGEGIHEAEILAWRIKAGDTVERDQPILEIQTDKAVVEISSPVSGVVAEIRAAPGQMATVGRVLVVIATEEPKPVAMPAPTATAVQAGPPQRVLAAPAVRKLALELGVDLTQVAGSGPAGRILPSDVRKAAEQTQPPTPSQENGKTVKKGTAPTTLPAAVPPLPQLSEEFVVEEALHGLRRRIAERMEQAWRVPHVAIFDEVDVTSLVTLRRHLQLEAERRGVRLTYLPFFIKATIQTLKEFPYFNASLDMTQQKILLRRYYHIGVATAVPEGLLVPVIRHADRRTLLQLAGELSRLTEAAHQRSLSLTELTGSTFTITNFGSFGTQQGTPIINPPEVAILGCGRIEEKPVVRGGAIVARMMLPLTLSFDHRLIDGAAAAAFLNRLKALLSDPNLLWLEMT